MRGRCNAPLHAQSWGGALCRSENRFGAKIDFSHIRPFEGVARTEPQYPWIVSPYGSRLQTGWLAKQDKKLRKERALRALGAGKEPQAASNRYEGRRDASPAARPPRRPSALYRTARIGDFFRDPLRTRLPDCRSGPGGETEWLVSYSGSRPRTAPRPIRRGSRARFRTGALATRSRSAPGLCESSTFVTTRPTTHPSSSSRTWPDERLAPRSDAS
jgi:hypothetical protein